MPQVLNQTYDEVVAKAQGLFWNEGYKGVNAKQLAEHIGVSVSTIYNKYSKEMLFLDSIEYYIQTYSDPFLSQLRSREEGIESLNWFFYALIDALLDKTFPRSCLMVNTVVELRNENEEVKGIYKRYFDALVSSYNIILDKAIDKGQLKHPEKKDEYSEFLLGIIFTLGILYKFHDKEYLQHYIDERLSFIV